MTAEVGVLNTMGVALAADSAVSIGPNADKIYSSADKLFNLCSSAPVGIMINGSASMLGYPWETIIKAYRKKSNGRLFATLLEYQNDFLKFVESNRNMFPASLQQEVAISHAHAYLRHIRDKVQSELNSEAENRDGLDESDIAPIINSVVVEELERVRAKDRLVGFGRATVAEVRKQYSRHITELKADVFGNLRIERKTQRAMTTVVVEMLTRCAFGPQCSEIVIAGYGEDEYLPRLYSTSIELMIRNKLRALSSRKSEVTPSNRAMIVPFAQQEMVHAFMTGIDPRINDHIRTTSDSLFLGMVNQILNAVETHDADFGKKLRRTVVPSAKSALAKVHENWDEQCVNYWAPIVNMAASLPKDELGAMAEALVNLTKFRRRVSRDRETVGGPIDVAVISKGDGFVWVKRKHYFKPELNPRIMYRLGRD